MARIVSIYFEHIAKLHTDRNSFHDYLFPNINIVKGIAYPCEQPGSYDNLLKTLKSEVSLALLTSTYKS